MTETQLQRNMLTLTFTLLITLFIRRNYYRVIRATCNSCGFKGVMTRGKLINVILLRSNYRHIFS